MTVKIHRTQRQGTETLRTAAVILGVGRVTWVFGESIDLQAYKARFDLARIIVFQPNQTFRGGITIPPAWLMRMYSYPHRSIGS